MNIRTLLVLPLGLVIGCSGGSEKPSTADKRQPAPKVASDKSPEAEIQSELAKLNPTDRELAEVQSLCVVTEEPLGSMGVPIKLTIKDQPVFICCAGCKKKAEADADKTLAKVEELKTKKKAGGPK